MTDESATPQCVRITERIGPVVALGALLLAVSSFGAAGSTPYAGAQRGGVQNERAYEAPAIFQFRAPSGLTQAPRQLGEEGGMIDTFETDGFTMRSFLDRFGPHSTPFDDTPTLPGSRKPTPERIEVDGARVEGGVSLEDWRGHLAGVPRFGGPRVASRCEAQNLSECHIGEGGGDVGPRCGDASGLAWSTVFGASPSVTQPVLGS